MRYLITAGLLFFMNVHSADRPSPFDDVEDLVHPCILTNPSEKAQILKRIGKYPWAKKAFDQIKRNADRFVERHQKDPQDILSRMPMYRKPGARYSITITFNEKRKDVKGAFESVERRICVEGDSPYPTVPYNSTYQNGGCYARYPGYFDTMAPYTGKNGVFELRWPKTGKPMCSKRPEDFHQDMWRQHHYFWAMAREAGFMYYLTGKKVYRDLAHDIIVFYCRGAQNQQVYIPRWGNKAAYNEVVKYYYDNSGKGDEIVTISRAKFDEWKKRRVLGEWPYVYSGYCLCYKCFAVLFAAYDFVYDSFTEKEHRYVQNVIKKVMRVTTYYGCNGGNGNLMEMWPACYGALVMKHNAYFDDNEGRQHFFKYVVKEDAKKQSCIGTHLAHHNDPKLGVMKETFSYGGAIGMLGNVVMACESAGYPITKEHPILLKGFYSFDLFTFPGSNGMSVSLGDCNSRSAPKLNNLELANSIAYLGGNVEQQQIIGSYMHELACGDANTRPRRMSDPIKTLVWIKPVLPVNECKRPPRPRVTELEHAKLIVQRTGQSDPDNAFTAAVFGAEFGHAHRDALGLTLFARGHYLAKDGSGGGWYNTFAHRHHNNRRAAHNTVIVNSLSLETKNPIQHLHQDPATGLQAADTVFKDGSFVDSTWSDPRAQADHRRCTGVFKLGPKAGFFVDIYRSRVKPGAKDKNGAPVRDITHDYLYHNAGQSIEFYDNAMKPLAMEDKVVLKEHPDFTEPNGDPSDRWNVGYGRLKKQATSGPYNRDFSVVFKDSSPKKPDSRGAFITRLWHRSCEQTEVVRIDKVPVGKQIIPGTPTFAVRRHGEAWNRPFVSVIYPYFEKEGNPIKSIAPLKGVPVSGDLVALQIKPDTAAATTPFSNLIVLNATDSNRKHDICGNISFKGIYGVVATGKKEMLYLGKGRELATERYRIKAASDGLVSACLTIEGGTAIVSCDANITLGLRGKTVNVPKAIGKQICVK